LPQADGGNAGQHRHDAALMALHTRMGCKNLPALPAVMYFLLVRGIEVKEQSRQAGGVI
jgi:hypothetical protein